MRRVSQQRGLSGRCKADLKAVKLLRILDANANRAREGLRVCEDAVRFLLDDPVVTRQYKRLRHRLTSAVLALGISELITARDIEGDVGRGTTKAERRRGGTRDIFLANSQRVKESLRVLEEFGKLCDGQVAEDVKRLRYAAYALEKKVVERF